MKENQPLDHFEEKPSTRFTRLSSFYLLGSLGSFIIMFLAVYFRLAPTANGLFKLTFLAVVVCWVISLVFWMRAIVKREPITLRLFATMVGILLILVIMFGIFSGAATSILM